MAEIVFQLIDILLPAVNVSCFPAIVVSMAFILSYTAFLLGAIPVTQSQELQYAVSLIAELCNAVAQAAAPLLIVAKSDITL